MGVRPSLIQVHHRSSLSVVPPHPAQVGVAVLDDAGLLVVVALVVYTLVAKAHLHQHPAQGPHGTTQHHVESPVKTHKYEKITQCTNHLLTYVLQAFKDKIFIQLENCTTDGFPIKFIRVDYTMRYAVALSRRCKWSISKCSLFSPDPLDTSFREAYCTVSVTDRAMLEL